MDSKTTIIEAGKLPPLSLGELWRYRSLFLMLAWRNIAVRYKQTRDDDSFEMLDLIFAGRVYDLGYYNVELTGAVGQDEAIANNYKYLTENKVGSMTLAWGRFGESAETRLLEYLDKLEQAVSG